MSNQIPSIKTDSFASYIQKSDIMKRAMFSAIISPDNISDDHPPKVLFYLHGAAPQYDIQKNVLSQEDYLKHISGTTPIFKQCANTHNCHIVSVCGDAIGFYQFRNRKP